jgi:membrane-associated phospholipid phosphatase
MPSLHFGWNLLVGIVLFTAFGCLAIRIFALTMPIAMAFAVVATANHFVLDVVVGVVVVTAGLAFALALERRRAHGTKGRSIPQNPDEQTAEPPLH